jgi:UDP-N-acetylmuramoyl-L-alanyl-D-glutamate--2,6-diaminopimelate ligase
MDRLLEGIEVVERSGDASGVEVASLELDSRLVEPGALFCCLPGRRHDGHDFAPEALGRGAVGLVVERLLPWPVPQARVAPGTMRQAVARLARTFYGDPARCLVTAGVTGTNGKTTVTHLLASILEAHGVACRVIGTLDGRLTTPEAPELHRALAEARGCGAGAVAMEVSSHALSEGRVEGIEFSVAVFTNLSHDHLDFHGSMEQYFAAKASLFRPGHAAAGVVNADDPWGRRLLASAEIPLVAFSASEATEISLGAHHTSFSWRGRRVRLPLVGSFHVANALAAAAAAGVLGVADDDVVAGLERAAPVPGRFEVVEGGAPFTVVVDYAHTPDALRSALSSARQLARGGRVLVVFGCGGDRDRAKRPVMGQVAAAGADVVVVTSDNPRSEPPQSIIEEILAGVPPGAAVWAEPDRAAAIALAVGVAEPGDVVLVAGKGHERFIESEGAKVPFEDRRQAAEAMARSARRARS